MNEQQEIVPKLFKLHPTLEASVYFSHRKVDLSVFARARSACIRIELYEGVPLHRLIKDFFAFLAFIIDMTLVSPQSQVIESASSIKCLQLILKYEYLTID